VRSRAVAAALIAQAAGGACAQAPAPPGLSGELSAGVQHRRLTEVGQDGRRLVQERGELLRVQAGAQLPLAGGGALRASAAIAAGSLAYRGQTQAGVPLATDAAHRDLELGLHWRPLPEARWGEAWLGLAALQQRRLIASQPAARGLRETSTLLLPGLRWTHALDAGGWRWQPALEVRTSVHHRLDVDFGGVFDGAALDGGRRRELLLALDAAPAASPWRFGVTWSRARQSASRVQTLARGGAPVGTVRQPRIEIDEVTVRATRAF
jgi:hypothetical protein